MISEILGDSEKEMQSPIQHLALLQRCKINTTFHSTNNTDEMKRKQINKKSWVKKHNLFGGGKDC